MIKNLKIKSIEVLLTNNTDEIFLKIDGDTTFPAMGYEPIAKIEAAHNFGAAWVRKHFNIEPKIIDSRRK